MRDNRRIEILVFGMIEGSNRTGRPHREQTDDITDWYGASLQRLGHNALDRKMEEIVKEAIGRQLAMSPCLLMMMMNNS